MATLEELIIEESKETILATGLEIAESIDLPVSSWRAGDPTRSLYVLEAELLAKLETIVVKFIRAGFLDYAAELAAEDPDSNEWLKILAEQVFGVVVPDATAATTTVRLTNTGGGLYEIAAGDLTLKSTSTDKTYHNTTGGTLNPGPGTVLDIDVEADELGSASSAAATEIDELVTTLLGVTCSNATAAVGVDELAPATIVQQCRDKLGSLSPNGPKEAYTYVARNPDLTGTNNVTRARVYPDSETGDVQLYIAGPSGSVANVDRDLVEAAILTYATPLCITPTVTSAGPVAIAITYTLWLYSSVNRTAAEVEDAVEAALETMFADRPIGGDIIPPSLTGALYRDKIASTIAEVFPDSTFRVTVAAPAGDTALTNGQVAVLGAVTATVNFVADP